MFKHFITEQADARNDVKNALPLIRLGNTLVSYFPLVHLVKRGLYCVDQSVHRRAEYLLVDFPRTMQNTDVDHLLDKVARLLYVLEVLLEVYETLFQYRNIVRVRNVEYVFVNYTEQYRLCALYRSAPHTFKNHWETRLHFAT